MRAEGRARQARAVANDRRLLEASAGLLAGPGWSGLSLGAAGRAMGGSEQLARVRASGRSDLAAQTWCHLLWPVLQAELNAAVSPFRAGAHEERVAQGLLALLARDGLHDAAGELLIMAGFDAQVREAVDATLGAWTRELLAPPPDEGARLAYLLAIGLGLLLSARSDRAATPGILDALRTRVRALRRECRPTALPPDGAWFLDRRMVLDEHDAQLDALLNVTLELVGTHGFDGVSAAQIAEASGSLEGLVFRRYPTKLAMLVDATAREHRASWQVNHDFSSKLKLDHGIGIAEAVLIREWLLPGRALPRTLTLEEHRLAWHHDEIGAAAARELDAFRASLLAQPDWSRFEGEADFFLNVSTPIGTLLLPLLDPQVWQLPWDVATVPLYNLLGEQAERPAD